MSPPGGILLRKAPGTAAFDFGQFIPLTTLWQPTQQQQQQQQQQLSLPSPLPVGARRRTTMQHGSGGAGGRLSPQPGKGQPGGQVALWDEITAWVTNCPDPLLAAEYLQRWVCPFCPLALRLAAFAERCQVKRAAPHRLLAGSIAATAEPPAAFSPSSFAHQPITPAPPGPRPGRSAAWRRTNTLHTPSGESFATPLPAGFGLKFVVLTSWGDPHYVGLCGIEVRRGLVSACAHICME